MWETPGRLLRMLELLQRRRHWSASAPAEELDVSTRTVRRDVDRLRAIGYPVDATPGLDGGYRLVPGVSLPPLMFDNEEAVATVLALRGAETGIAGLDDSTLSALTKLAAVMPRRLQRKVEALASQVSHVQYGGMVGQAPVSVDLAVLTDAAVACREHLLLQGRYRSHDGVESVRRLEPNRVVRSGAGWYLIAWDLTRHDWRTLRLDRFTELELTNRTVPSRPPPAEDLDAYMAEQIGAGIRQVRAVVRVHAPAATARPWIDPAWGHLEAETETSCVLHAGADTLAGMARWLLLLDADLTVIDPPALAEEFARLARRARRAAGSVATGSPA